MHAQEKRFLQEYPEFYTLYTFNIGPYGGDWYWLPFIAYVAQLIG